MAPRSKARTSKKKAVSSSTAEKVLREEILGRIFDYLSVRVILDSAATCKQFDAALSHVTHFSSFDERVQKAEGLWIWTRLPNVKFVKIDVHAADLALFFTNAVRGGKKWVSIDVDVYTGLDDENYIRQLEHDVKGFAKALKRGALPNLDHYAMDLDSIFEDYIAPNRTLLSGFQDIYTCLPPLAGAMGAIRDFGNAHLLRRILDNSDLDMDAPDSRGDTLLATWCQEAECEIAPIFEVLVSRGANVNQVREGDGFSPCSMAADSAEFQDTKLRLLLERGASIAVGVSPLLLLCGDRQEAGFVSPNVKALKLLLSHGCDIMETGGRGKTAVELVDLHLRKFQDRLSAVPDSPHFKKGISELQSMMSVLALASTSLLKSAHEEIGSLKKDAEQRPGASKRTAAGKAKKKKARS
jgi:hypothetical protein